MKAAAKSTPSPIHHDRLEALIDALEFDVMQASDLARALGRLLQEFLEGDGSVETAGCCQAVLNELHERLRLIEEKRGELWSTRAPKAA